MADNVIETGRSRIEDILLKASNGEALSRIEEILLTLYNEIFHLGPDGKIPAELIPPQVFERMITVADDAARFALTTDDVQNGDWVYVNSTQSIYYVYDEDHLDTEAGYKPVSAGIAAKAIADQYGNVIDTTYAKDADLDALTTRVGTNANNILSEQAKTTGMSEGGSNYITVGGIRVYVSATAPTGARTGDLWIGG